MKPHDWYAAVRGPNHWIDRAPPTEGPLTTKQQLTGSRSIAFQQKIHSRRQRTTQTMSKVSKNRLNLTRGWARQFSEEVCITLMEEVLRSSGQSVSLDCVTDTVPIRQRFYRTRKRYQARGYHRFDELKFYLPCFSRLVVYRPAPGSSQRDARIRAEGGKRYLVSPDDIILVWSEDDTE